MSAPAWFDKDVYLANKLAQLQADEPNNGWDMLKMLEAFNNAGFNPFTDDGIYAHFVAFGNAEGISPNAYFDEGTYFTNKLAQLQATEPDKGWTSVDQVKEAFADAGLSAWDHYTLYGAAEGVSPSKYFDTNAYMKAKLAQMQADDPAYTMTQLEQAFKDADLNPIEHYILYGKNENLSYTPYPVIVDDNKPVVELTGTNTFEVNGKAATELPSEDYQLVGDAAELSSAKYEIVAGAKGDVVLKDSVATLAALGDNVKEALGLASKVTVEGTLNELMNADLPSDVAAKVSGYEVTKIDAIAMNDVTVAQATGIQTALATFLSNPYVTYADGISAPESADDVTVTIDSITDTVANIAAADFSKIGDKETVVNVKDTAANVDNMTAALSSEIKSGNDDHAAGKIFVEDKMSNILGMKTYANVESFTSTDTSANFTLDSGDMSTVLNGKTVTFNSLQDNATVNITMDDDLHTLDASIFTVKDASGVTFDITGTTTADTITANDLGGIIDGNGGNDTINLGTGADTVAFDKWDTAASVTITGFDQGKDTLDFSGNELLNFDFSKAVTSVATNGVIGSDDYSEGGVFFLTGSAAALSQESGVTALFTDSGNSNFDDGTSFLIVANGDTQGTFVWYVEAANGGTITDGEVHLVAHLDDAAGLNLTAADFGVTGA